MYTSISRSLKRLLRLLTSTKGFMVVSEGGAKSELWRQIVADVFGVPVAYQKETRGAPEGDAIAVGVATGVYKSYRIAKEWVNYSAINEPNMKNHAHYMELFQIYKKVYEGVKDQFDPLADLVGRYQ